MKHLPTIFLQVVLVLIGFGALTFLLWEPHLEGVNATATFWEVYRDPFILFIYVGSVPFFVALFQAIKLLRYVQLNTAFSLKSVNALQTIRYCAVAIVGFVAAAQGFIILNHGNDDAAGAISLGMMIIVGSVIAGAAATTLKRALLGALK